MIVDDRGREFPDVDNRDGNVFAGCLYVLAGYLVLAGLLAALWLVFVN